MTLKFIVCAMLACSFARAEEASRAELLARLKDGTDPRQLGAIKHLLKEGPFDAELARALSGVLGDPSPDVRRAAALGLEKVGAPAKEFVPKLLALVKDADSSVRGAAISALGVLGPPGKDALPALLDALKDQIPQLRVAALEALRRHALKESPEARAALLEFAAAEKHPDVINALTSCLAELDPLPPETATFFAAGLRGSGMTRTKSVEALTKIGPRAAPVIVPQLSSEYVTVRRDAAALLETFLKDKAAAATLKSPELIHALATALKDSDIYVRRSAANTLVSFGRDALPALPEILKRLADTGDSQARVTAAGIIESLNVPIPDAIPPLIEMLQDKYAGTRVAAARALAKQGPGPALDGAVALLKATRDEVRTSAATAVGLFGPAAEPSLLPLLKSEKIEDVSVALSALSSMGGPRAEAVPAVIAALKHSKNLVRSQASTALAKSGVHALPAMLTALRSIDKCATPGQPNEFAQALTDAFGRIGAPAVPSLLSLLEGSVGHVVKTPDAARNEAVTVELVTHDTASEKLCVSARVAAMDALGKIGPTAAPAIPLLLSELEHVPAPPPNAPVPPKKSIQNAAGSAQNISPRARETAAACYALGGIGRASEAAIPVLFELLKDADASVRQEAGRAISKIATGKERIPPLAEIIERGDSGSLSNALRNFENAGLEALLTETDSTNNQTRQRLASTLGNLPLASVAPFMTEALKTSTEPKVRALAAYMLGEMRQNRRQRDTTSSTLDAPLPVLQAAVRDADPDVCVLAAYACTKAIDPDDEELIAKIAKGVAQCAPENRSRALTALSYYNLQKHGRKAAAALPVLIRGLNGEYPGNIPVKTILQHIGLQREDVPAIVEALKDKNTYTRRAALKLIEQMGPEAREACPALLDLLADDERFGSRALDAAFNAIGAEAVPFLIDAIKNAATPEPLDRKAAKFRNRNGVAQILAQMKLDNECLQRVADLLADDRADVRAGAVVVLAAGASRAQYALPHLKQLLTDDDRLVARQGAELISSMGNDAVPTLVDLASDPHPQLRTRAATCLRPHDGNILPEALGALLKLVKDESSEVKAAALVSLASAKGNEIEVIRELPAALQDDNQSTRRAAITYLSKHGKAAPSETIAALALVLKDKNAEARLKASAINALQELGHKATELKVKVALPAALVAAAQPAPEPNEQVLPKFNDDPNVPPAAPKIEIEVTLESLLFGALGDPEHRVRAEAADALASLGLDKDPQKKMLINEMFAYDALEEYAHAQEDYFIKTWDDQRTHYYAATLRELNPLSRNIAAADKLAVAEPPPPVGAKPAGRPLPPPGPYNGYWFKRLETQGASAPGGAKKFIVEGRFSQGHALAAFPHEYGKTGRFTFLIGDDGSIWKKDIGAETEKFCAALNELNPDATWEKSKVRPKEDQPVRFHPQEQEPAPLEF